MELTHRAPDRVSRGHRPMFSSSDDSSMLNQILATHAPDGREFEVCQVLRVLESVFRRAKPTASGAVPVRKIKFTLLSRSWIPYAIILQEGQPQSEIPDDAAIRDTLEFLADTINRVACEVLSCPNNPTATVEISFFPCKNFLIRNQCRVASSPSGITITEYII